MDNQLFQTMKAKLARGGQLNGGELALITREIASIIESHAEKINELEAQLSALAKRSDRGAKKSSPKPPVQADDVE